MTVKEMEAYFADREFFPNPDQQVQLKLDNGVRVELGGTVVPEKGAATVRLRKARTRKFMFRLTFEANPVIEACSFEEADRKAHEMMDDLAVKNLDTDVVDESFVGQEPMEIEEEPV